MYKNQTVIFRFEDIVINSIYIFVLYFNTFMNMNKLIVFFLVIISGVSVAQQKPDLVISNPIIIQISDGFLLHGHDIIVQGKRISGIVKHKKKYASSTRVIDAKGKYIIPGLCDMHIHFGGGDSLVQENKNLLPLYIAHGITAVRDAAADLSPHVLKWRTEISNGTLLGPAIFTSGPKIEGINSIWLGY
jgi:hypothetical protein